MSKSPNGRNGRIGLFRGLSKWLTVAMLVYSVLAIAGAVVFGAALLSLKIWP